MARCLWIILIMMSAGLARAADLPILDVAAVPHLKPADRHVYANFLLGNEPRVFAISSSGAYGWQAGGGTLDQVRAKALGSCARNGATDCTVYAENLSVVYPGRPRVDPPAVPGPLLSGSGYAFVPDDRFLWFTQAAARGLFIWGHGKAGNQSDESHDQPQNYVRAFNNDGFAVVRFARDPTSDSADNASDWLRESLPKLRAQGWHMIVVGGQSTGGWASLAALNRPGMVDAVIAVSAAYLSTSNIGAQAAGLYRVTHAANAPNTRVALVYFQGDPFVTEGIDTRLEHLKDGLTGRVGPLLIIDRPPGFTGHGGANRYDFGRRYGPCLLRFVLDTPPPTHCDGSGE